MVSPPSPESASTTSNPPSPAKLEAAPTVHRTKLVQFLGRRTPIFLQNNNGPCPLLAICNALSLKNSLNLDPNIQEVSQEELLSSVAQSLIDSNSSPDDIHCAIDLLDRLTTGIDVNIKFRRIDDFEFTSECKLFALLDIPLYHGWIVDPQDNETVDAIGSKSYNTVMEELVAISETKPMEIEQNKNLGDHHDNVDFVAARKPRKGDLEEAAELLRVTKLSTQETSYVNNSKTEGKNVTEETVNKGTSDSESSDSGTVFSNNREPVYEGESLLSEKLNINNGVSVKQGEIIKNFMENNAIQLTEYGLSCLKENVNESEICVFFRNNHFNTMFKYEGELYILVTDQGYIHHSDLVWEKLNEVNGDNEYTTGDFERFKMDDCSKYTWDEQKAIVNTEDYFAAYSDDEDSSSDDYELRLEKALKQLDLDEQELRNLHRP